MYTYILCFNNSKRKEKSIKSDNVLKNIKSTYFRKYSIVSISEKNLKKILEKQPVFNQ